MPYQSTAAMLAEMRDLGFDGDADSWESYIREECSREDMRDVRCDIRAELDSMRNAEIVRNADHPATKW